MEQYKWIRTGIFTSVSEAAVSRIVAIRYCTLQPCFSNPCPTFSVSRLRDAACCISTHSHHTLRSLSLLLLYIYLVFLIQSTTKSHLKWSKNDVPGYHVLALVKLKRVKTCPRQGDSGGVPSPSGGGQGSSLRRDHQCTGRVQCTGI